MKEYKQLNIDYDRAKNEFLSFVNQFAKNPLTHVQVGKWVRFEAVNDKKGQKSASYRYFENVGKGVPSGMVGDFKNGIEEKWVYTITKKDIVENKKVEKRQIYFACNEQNKDNDIQKVITEDLNKLYLLSHQVVSHEYLNKKSIDSNPFLRIVPKNNVDFDSDFIHIANSYAEARKIREDNKNKECQTVLIAGSLIIPILNERKIQSFQIIDPMAQCKFYVAGAKKSGGWFNFGNVTNGEPILICEGYATAATVYKLTKKTTIVAFDANNLLSVAEVMRDRNPDSNIYIMADNDHAKNINTGMIKAAEVANKVSNVRIIAPVFEKNENYSDWNDLYIIKGGAECVFQMKKQLSH